MDSSVNSWATLDNENQRKALLDMGLMDSLVQPFTLVGDPLKRFGIRGSKVRILSLRPQNMKGLQVTACNPFVFSARSFLAKRSHAASCSFHRHFADALRLRRFIESTEEASAARSARLSRRAHGHDAAINDHAAITSTKSEAPMRAHRGL
jgi:hypothetical protein